MAQRYQVVIVGGGPVGMALAVELGQRDISVAVIERHHEVGRIPKGQNLTNRTLEHFYFWHCVEELRRSRLLPPGYPIGGVTAYGSLSSDYWHVPEMPMRRDGRPFFFQANERLPQYITEEVLRARAAELPSVHCFFEQMAKEITQDDNGVHIVASSDVWPYEDEEYDCDYAVGCDGARSMVRETLGIKRTGTNFDQKMVLAVFSAPGLHDGLERFPERTTYHVVNPDLEGKWQFFGRVEVGKSFFFHAPVPRETTPQDTEYLHHLMEEAAGFSFEVEFEHIGFWELRIDVATHYGEGRVFIAGDACHSHPPYGGFGLNTGLEDITNLGWKLAAALNGWGGKKLLDSYSEERQPIFVHTGEDVIAGGIIEEREWLKKHNLERDPVDFEKAWAERTGGEGNNRLAPYEVHYEGSSVVFGPKGAHIGIDGPPSFEARPGRHFAPSVLSNGKNAFEELGTGFTLFSLDGDDSASLQIEHAAAALGIPLTVVRDTYDGERAAYGKHLILVRPDQFVCWAGDEIEGDATALLQKVAGLD